LLSGHDVILSSQWKMLFWKVGGVDAGFQDAHSYSAGMIKK
jgi:hypothetical protein